MSRSVTPLTQKINDIASTFKVTANTVRRWHREGCDIFDAGAVYHWQKKKQSWRKDRRKKLKLTEEQTALNGQRSDAAGILNFEILKNLPPPSGEGAAAALKRLQGLESIFYSRQIEALANGRTELISFALNDYRKITESLRMYEREVEAAMRDAGQLIARGEAESGAAAVARWFRLAWRLWLSSCTPDLLQLAGDARRFKAEAERSFGEIMQSVFARARHAKIEVPAWAISAIREEYRAEIPDNVVLGPDPMG